MKKVLVGLSLAVFLAACGTKETPKETPVVDARPSTSTTTTPPPTTQSTNQQPVAGQRIDPLKDPNNPLSKRVVYFDYDKDAVRAEYQQLIQAHAAYLAQNRNRKIRLEGHADERGSREYNMALGQRRADAVRKATSVLGVGNERMETISFGEDKPKSNGHDEAAWAQNRRVEIVYDGE
jgi:peptidoglycan-associated lipoprotein